MSDVVSGACDAHTHIFPPRDAFRLAFETSYAPPVADVAEQAAMLDASGLTYGVVVQPGVYGTDPAALLDALGRSSGRLRGVAAVDGDASHAHLASLYDAGVRGLRFTEVRDPVSGGRYRGTVGLEALDTLAPAMRAIGLHAQIWAPLSDIVANIGRLRASGVSVVLDHMAMVDAVSGAGRADFDTLLNHLDEGWLWVKLSLCRVSRTIDHTEIRPFHDAFVSRAPRRMLWASDWPFVRMDPAPDPRALLARFLQWVPDQSVRDAILAQNPAQLYQFEKMDKTS